MSTCPQICLKIVTDTALLYPPLNKKRNLSVSCISYRFVLERGRKVSLRPVLAYFTVLLTENYSWQQCQ